MALETGLKSSIRKADLHLKSVDDLARWLPSPRAAPDRVSGHYGDAVPADLTSRAAAARRARMEANRSASCEPCPSLNAAA